jgi:NhaP-type Na+/H+ or K+/H+ antiporter
LLRLGIGGGIGAIGGWLLGVFLKQAKALSDDLKNLVVLAGVWGLFAAAQCLRSESGLMTMVVAGIVLRASAIPEERLIRRFKGQLTILAVSVLFILLSADLSIASLFVLGQGALLTVAVLMWVVRPLNIWLCTWNSGMSWRQKLFLCWISPRGIVSASVATLFAILLTERGINGGDSIKALVFLTIISTVVLQGLTAGWMAQWLGVTSEQATGAVIVGCNPLSLLIARLLRERGEGVVLIDTDAGAIASAQEAGFQGFASSALDTKVLEEAGLDKAGTFLAMTSNSEVNQVLAQRAAEEFQPPRVLAVFAEAQSGASKVQQAFAPDVSLKTWNRYLEDGAIKLGVTMLRDPELLFQQAHLQALMRAEELVPLLVEREDRLLVAPAMENWEVGDRIIYLFHDPRPKLLRQLSGGNKPLVAEKLPRVEEVPIATLGLEGGEAID